MEDTEQNQMMEISKLDLNGFISNSKESIKPSPSELKKVNARIQKWRQMIPSIQQTMIDKKKNKKLKSRIRKGIPQAMRIKIWPLLAECDKLKKQYNVDFDKLLEEKEFPQSEVINVDLPRTFPNHNMFKIQEHENAINRSSLRNKSQLSNGNSSSNVSAVRPVKSSGLQELDDQLEIINDDSIKEIQSPQKKRKDNPQNNNNNGGDDQNEQNNSDTKPQEQMQEIKPQYTESQIREFTLGQKCLQNVLKATALSFRDMGYCQGLNFVGASMLIYMNDEEAFMMLYSLMEKYSCLELYLNVASIHKYIHVFEGLMQKFLPKLKDRLEKLSIQPLFYVTPWFMTLFASVLPFNLFARVFDIFLYENHKVIYRVAMGMLKLKENQLMKATNMDQAMEIVKDYNFYSQIKEDDFIKTSMSFIFSKKLIVQLEEEYNEKNVVSRSRTQY